MNRDLFFRIYFRLESLITPGLKYCQTVYEEVLNRYCPKAENWLDLGCGHHLLPPDRFEQEKALIEKPRFVAGLDYDFLSLTKHRTIRNRIRGTITELPFPDDSFDLITSNMVVEHLDTPETQLKEIHRVLKKGGKFIFLTPNALGYSTLLARMVPESLKAKLIYFLQKREEDDVFPAWYRINTPSAIERLASECGFHATEIRLICSSAQFIMLPPLVFFELLWLRFLLSKSARNLRPNIIAILEKN